MTPAADAAPRFHFAQLEFAGQLGPPDGRFIVRAPGASAESPPEHVLVIGTLGARRRGLLPERRSRSAPPQPEPSPLAITRVTVINPAPSRTDAEARAWLAKAGEDELRTAVTVLNRALEAHRLAAADPYVLPRRREDALVARIGYGTGEQVADGHWDEARELTTPHDRTHRRSASEPQSRFAALLGSRRKPLLCEDLVLRARLDLQLGNHRAAALALGCALAAALIELADGSASGNQVGAPGRLAELSDHRTAVGPVAEAALRGALDADQLTTLNAACRALESAIRSRQSS